MNIGNAKIIRPFQTFFVVVVAVFDNNCIRVNAVLCNIQTQTAILCAIHGICFRVSADGSLKTKDG